MFNWFKKPEEKKPYCMVTMKLKGNTSLTITMMDKVGCEEFVKNMMNNPHKHVCYGDKYGYCTDDLLFYTIEYYE